MGTTRRLDKEQFMIVAANVPINLFREAKKKIGEQHITMNCIIQAALEDYIDWGGLPRWLVERDLIIQDRARKLKQ